MNTRERFVVAAVVSVGLHALLISGGWLPAPVVPTAQPPLEARLVPLPAAQPVNAPRPQPEYHPAPSRPRRSSRPPSPAPEVVTQAPAKPAEPRAEASELADAASSSGESAAAQQAAATDRADPPPASNVPQASGTVEGPTGDRVPGGLPRKGTITFALTLAGDGFSVGRAVQSWEVGAGSYRLASDAETTGLVDLFRPQRLRWLSKGTVTREGLKPESFLVSRTRRGQTEASEAQFNWTAGSLTYGLVRERATAVLPRDTQDIMSFIYQFSLAPPAPGRYRVPITTGAKFETYDIEVRAEETIETPLGTMRTIPVRQQRRPGAESIEIWLAAQYRYLPVKIRYFDREGKPAGEQVASDIRVSDD